MLDTNRAHTLLARGLLLAIALMLCVSLCVLATAPANADYELIYEDGGTTAAKDINREKEIPKILVLPEDITEISQNGFSNLAGIEKVVFPSTLTKIGSYAFSYCDGLTEITIPKGVNVGVEAFSNCPSLKTVKILHGGVTIERKAFSSCPNLQYVELASDVTFNGTSSFTGGAAGLTIHCDNGQITGVGDDAVKWEDHLPDNSEAAYEYEYTKDDSKLTVKKYHGKSTDPVIPAQINGKDVTDIASGAFDDCSQTIQSITVLSTKLNPIPDGAFPDKVVLKGYKGPVKDYADDPSRPNVTFEDQNMTETHKVAVAENSKDWLSFSVGADEAAAVKAERHTELDVIPNDSKYITVWIEQMDNGNDRLIDGICVKNTENSPEPGDDPVNYEKSVYVIIAGAQDKLEPGAGCVPENLRRYTFPMPGANIKVSAGLDQLVKGPAVPDSNGGIPGDDPSPPPSLP